MGMVTPAMMSAAQAAGYQKLDQGTTWTHGIFFNLDASNADSPIADVNVRKAIRAAIDCNAVLLALSGEEEANVLQPYPVLTTSPYHNTIISDNEWNIADKALAKEYLQKANYDGTAIKWLVPANNNMYTIAMGAIPQLEEVGIKIELMVVDSGSHSSMRKDPKTGHDIGAWNVQKKDVNPVLHDTIVTGTQGWWSSDAKTAAIQKMQTNPTGSAASIEGYKEWCQAVVD
jgi:ABC-type transport system substrate-binding protein